MQTLKVHPFVAVACGGTGGHLFPGLAVAEALQQRDLGVLLLISSKEVDQVGAQSASGMEVVTLPAVALQAGTRIGFWPGAWASFRLCLKLYRQRRPHAVLVMGGFTSAPAILAGKLCGAATFLHESNSVAGRANRWMSPFVDQAFLGFASAASRLHTPSVRVTGTPVRSQFQLAEAASCRMALGLDPEKPVLLVMGGSQGAGGINDLVMRTIPWLAARAPELQFLHLTGTSDRDLVRAAYEKASRKAVVRPFLTEMEMALGAASVAISRAGASSLAELAAMQVPAILIPFPFAADHHQFYNAHAFMETGAARQLDQTSATPEHLADLVVHLIWDDATRGRMQAALKKWHAPDAAEAIADHILQAVQKRALKLRDPDPSWKCSGLATGLGAAHDPNPPRETCRRRLEESQ